MLCARPRDNQFKYFQLPVGNIFVNVETAFDAGTTNKLDVGIVGNSDYILIMLK